VPPRNPTFSGQLIPIVARAARVYVFGSSQLAAAGGFAAGCIAGFGAALEPALPVLAIALGAAAGTPAAAEVAELPALAVAAEAPATLGVAGRSTLAAAGGISPLMAAAAEPAVLGPSSGIAAG
jgi:hypothetical protein